MKLESNKLINPRRTTSVGSRPKITKIKITNGATIDITISTIFGRDPSRNRLGSGRKSIEIRPEIDRDPTKNRLGSDQKPTRIRLNPDQFSIEFWPTTDRGMAESHLWPYPDRLLVRLRPASMVPRTKTGGDRAERTVVHKLRGVKRARDHLYIC